MDHLRHMYSAVTVPRRRRRSAAVRSAARGPGLLLLNAQAMLIESEVSSARDSSGKDWSSKKKLSSSLKTDISPSFTSLDASFSFVEVNLKYEQSTEGCFFLVIMLYLFRHEEKNFISSCEPAEVGPKLAAAEEAFEFSLRTTATICRVLSLDSIVDSGASDHMTRAPILCTNYLGTKSKILAMINGVLLEKQVIVICPNLGVLSAAVLSMVL
ncbi:hypothetical protein F3Y22_tig00111621pilonHSYRG00383 [Hibiscus syriacus]|uniref:Uncharacterized protein n=1 Tax=Hibiscus syriacus TaxID=106335 RepID=A0A6A2XL49_HIBSY|nr:hypothetical protein F3Y22_tig00111621pilonHSYRG00383 [Hibiscus syriacus]